ncbi:MAG: hypothetical protein KAJ43_10080 [Gemmatimonadetes bacterium]|nr:hypothetical protein [Gemmatimonadota bacterium]
MCDDLLEVWRTNNRISLHLIDRISDAGMHCTMSKRGGRGISGQLGHIHNVRVWHLEKRARDLAEGLVTFQAKQVPSCGQLREAFEASGAAFETFLSELQSSELCDLGLGSDVRAGRH